VVEIAKESYVENYVFYRTATTAYRFEGNKALTMVEKGEPLACLDAQTAYIRLTEFNGAAAGEFQKAMSQFRKDNMQNLVLDLRGNGGGFLNIMQDIAAYFCKNSKAKNPLAAVADYGEYKQDFRANGNYYGDYFNEDSRICVLADSESASASECLIGCMVDYGAVSYGDICLTERNGVAKTYGKGIMQTTIPLIFGGDAVKLTSAVIRWPISNHCIHGRGILPEDGALVVAETGDFDGEIAASVAKLFS
jgi:C-terminal processing protease CtpA/Prc